MYLLGHTDAKFTMRVYQQVLDVGADTGRQLTELLGPSAEDAAIQQSGRAHWASDRPDALKSVSAETSWESSERENPLQERDSAKRLMRLEPTTFCMASRSCGDARVFSKPSANRLRRGLARRRVRALSAAPEPARARRAAARA